MAYNLQTSIDISQQCGEDLSANQFCFVNLGTDSLLYGGDKTSHALGILTNAPSATAKGQYAGTVAVTGVTRLEVGGAYAIGTYLVPSTDGTTKGIGYSVADASANCKYIRARALQASAADGDVVAVLLVDSNPGMDSTTL